MEKEKKGFVIKQGNDMPLGISLQNNSYQFAVSMPKSSSCNLVLYKKGEKEPTEVIPMMKSASGIFSISVAISKKLGHTGYEYLYQTEENYVCDPYAVKVNGREQFGKEPRFIRAEVFVPEKEERKPYCHHELSELILYKAHVRGFTKMSNSGVKKKGTFAGLTEKIPYLKELGINAILLMPIIEFDELENAHKYQHSVILGEPERKYYGQKEEPELVKQEVEVVEKVNYWGYTSAAYYFAPKASYAANSKKAVEEVKQMVDAFHEAGIDVYLEMMFGTDCSQSYMLDCLRHWVRCYGIDGFHINDSILPVSLVAGDAYLQQTVFMISDVPEWLKEKYPSRFLEYRDNFCVEMRRYLKGDEGFISSLCHYMKYRRTDMGKVVYVADHNGFTLADLYSYDVRHNEANGEQGKDGTEYNYSWNCGEEGPTRKPRIQNLRMQMMKNAMALVFLSQGVPLLLGGDEFGRTKKGNNNSYCQDNAVSWIDWKLLQKNKEFFEYVKELIAFRKAHPLFTLDRELKETDFISCGWPEVSVHGITPWHIDYASYNRLAGFLYCGNYIRKSDRTLEDSFYIMFNMHWELHEFELPMIDGMEWEIVFHTTDDLIVGKKVGESVIAEARTIIVLKSVKEIKVNLEEYLEQEVVISDLTKDEESVLNIVKIEAEEKELIEVKEKEWNDEETVS